jgi:geranylgeranyl pyrophosphate synthase
MTEQKHHDFSAAMTKLFMEQGKELRPVEMIAIVSYTLGGLLSLLPDEVVTNGAALELIQRNLEAGNAETNDALAPLNMLVSSEPITE